MLDQLLGDVRFGARTLLRNRAFAGTAIFTLALATGATTAIFSVVNSLILSPLPFADPARLVQMHGKSALVPRADAVSNLAVLRRDTTSFDALVSYDVSARFLREGDTAERVMTVRAERDFFRMLGVPPMRGRTFDPTDPLTVAVVSERFWQDRLRGRADVVGSTLLLDDETVTIVGVMPESFQFPYSAASLLPGAASEMRTDMWMPADPPSRPGARSSSVTGRLKPDVTLASAESELTVVTRRLEAEDPERSRGRGVYLEPLAESVVSAPVRRVLFLLLGAVGLVLALACANVANLSLARMTTRAREVAVRSALGAGRARLARQFLTESLLISLLGGALGLGIAEWGADEVMRFAGQYIPRSHEIGLDWRVFLFLLAACTMTSVALAIASAMFVARSNLQSVLQESGGYSTFGASRQRVRDTLVIAEVALAFLLAVGAAILIRELVRLRQTDTGMVTSRVVTFHLGHRMTPQTDVQQFYQIEDRVSSLPDVRAAGLIQMLPLQSWGWTSNSADFTVKGRVPAAGEYPIELRYVTPGYFNALGIAVKQGRAFTDADTRDAPRVIMITETLARRAFGGDDPIGVETSRGTVIGIVDDVRQVNLDMPAAPEIYFPVAQNWSQVSELGMTLVVSTRNRPEAVIDSVRAVIRDVNPRQAIFGVKRMDQVVAESMADFTLYLSLSAGFAALALVMAMTGTYGVISYIATSRSREFAIRIALGATRSRVVNLVLRQGVVLAAIGVGVGLVAAFAVAPLLRDLPVSVRPPDVATTAPVAVVIEVVAVVACLIPARRAARVDPMSTLRAE